MKLAAVLLAGGRWTVHARGFDREQLGHKTVGGWAESYMSILVVKFDHVALSCAKKKNKRGRENERERGEDRLVQNKNGPPVASTPG